ncbi:hypothetical protein [Bacteroides thetaiotaomicron]|nr:hypothetical protein [Bacteroides thetaiotaomicron]
MFALKQKMREPDVAAYEVSNVEEQLTGRNLGSLRRQVKKRENLLHGVHR